MAAAAARRRRPGALRGAEGLARRGRARAQPAGLRDLPRRDAGRDRALAPRSLADLQGVSGIGAKKLEAYGAEVLRVVNDCAALLFRQGVGELDVQWRAPSIVGNALQNDFERALVFRRRAPENLPDLVFQ